MSTITAYKSNYFVALYINSGPDASALSPYEILAKKAKYAQDILKMYDIICPGYTKERGLTLFELFASSFNMIKLEASSKTNKDAGECNSEQTIGISYTALSSYLYFKIIIINVLFKTPFLKLEYIVSIYF